MKRGREKKPPFKVQVEGRTSEIIDAHQGTRKSKGVRIIGDCVAALIWPIEGEKFLFTLGRQGNPLARRPLARAETSDLSFEKNKLSFLPFPRT